MALSQAMHPGSSDHPVLIERQRAMHTLAGDFQAIRGRAGQRPLGSPRAPAPTGSHSAATILVELDTLAYRLYHQVERLGDTIA